MTRRTTSRRSLARRNRSINRTTDTVLETLEGRTMLSTYTVSNLSDAGAGSLRQAILDANLNAGADTISFSTGGGTISLDSALPVVTDSVLIDATTEAGYSGSPIVHLDGSALAGADGLHILANSSAVRGLSIGGFVDGAGVRLAGSNDAVRDSYIGVGLNGHDTAGNSANWDGVAVQGSGAVVERNVISMNLNAGVNVTGNSATIRANLIGTDAAGSDWLGNNFAGVYVTAGATSTLIGGPNAADRNVIDASAGSGVDLEGAGAGTLVEGNYIGLDVAGTFGLGNSGNGVFIHESTATALVKNNVISGNVGDGVRIYNASNVTVVGNLIGTDATGALTMGSDNWELGNSGQGVVLRLNSNNNTIGGPTAADRNVISGNFGDGVRVNTNANTSGNIVRGNYLGTDAAGLISLGNYGNGITAFAPVLITANVISGNQGYGADLRGAATLSGNWIGTQPGGVSALANLQDGVNIDGDANTVNSNTIAFNAANGVVVISGLGNSIRGNSIHNNTLLGIDLNADGVTINDSLGHDGPNALQNFPLLSSALGAGGPVTVSGTIHAAPNATFAIDLYGNAAADPSGFGEGAAYLGSVNVTTNGSGAGSFSTAVTVPGGASIITATATDASGNTSEFSPSVSVQIETSSTIATATTLATSANPVVYGNAVTLTATVIPITGTTAPAGDVEFYEGTTLLGTVALNGSAQATLLWSFALGDHTLTAVYLGNSEFVGGSSAPLTQSVIGTATIIGAAHTDEGSLYTLNLSTNVPTVNSWTVNWGDGNVQSVGGNPSSLTHVYLDGPSAYTVSASATDGSVVLSTNTRLVTVDNVRPFAFAGPDQTANEGSAVTLNGTFTDPGVLDTHSFLWQVSASNGQVVADGHSAGFTFTPVDNGTYTLTLTVTDKDGGFDTDQVIVTVLNVAPVANAGGGQTINENSSASLSGSATDVGAIDTLTYAWNVVASNGQVVPAASGAALNFTALDNGTYTATLTVTDKDGASASSSAVVTVLNVAPAANAGPDQTVNEDTAVSLTGSASDVGPLDTLTYAWSAAASNGQVVASGAGTTYGFTALDNGTYTVTLTVTDKDGASTSDQAIITVLNVAPTADAGPDQTVNEGSIVSLTGAGTDAGSLDALSYAWHVVASNGQAIADATGPSFSFTAIDNGTYTVTLSVTDKDGAVTTDSALVTALNVAPTVSAGADQTVDEGTTVTLSGSANDPGVLDTIAYSWHVVASNGQVVADAAGSAFSFAALDNGTYTVTLTATDNDGASSTDTAVVTVLNVAPTASAGADQTVNEGTAVTLSGSSTDAGVLDAPALAWHVVASNGQVVSDSTGSTFNFTALDNGNYTVTLTATDKDGASSTDTAVVTVLNVAPSADAGADQTVNEGTTVTLTGSASDPGVLDTLSYSWHVVASNGQAIADAAGPAFTFTPADNGTYTLTLTVTDKDGGVGTDTAVVTVLNVAPVANAGSGSTINEGSSVSLTGSASDVGTLDTLSYAWTVVASNGQSVPAASGLTLSFTALDNGTYTATLTVTDKDGASSSSDAVVTVLNVAPTANAGADQSTTAGTSVGLAGTFTDPGTLDTHTFNWHVVASNGQVIADGIAQSFSFTPTASGTYTLTFTVTDKDGGSAADVAVVTVASVPPPTTGTINGTKFLDITGNGFSADDTGLSGVTIQLYADVNHNGTLDAADGTAFATRVSAANGTFSFGSLAAGTYFVKEVVPSGYLRTGPANSDTYTIALAAGQTVTGIDFDNVKTGPCACNLGSVQYIINGSTLVTDLRGKVNQGDQVTAHFTYSGTTPQQITLVSYTAPTPNFDANNASQQTIFDIDTRLVQPGETVDLTVQVPNSYFQIDFVCGFAIDKLGPAGSNIFYTPQGRLISADNDGTNAPVANPGSVAGVVYRDINNDGVKQATEPGIGGVTVTLTRTDASGLALTRVTDATGAYSFLGLPAGTYKLVESQPAAYADGKDTLGTVNGVTRGTLGNDTFTSIALGAGQVGVNYIFGEGAPTKFYVVDGTSRGTYRYDADGNYTSNSSLSSANSTPRGIAANKENTKLWTIDGNKKVYVYNASGALLGGWTASDSNAPTGVTTNGTDVWIVSAGDRKVRRYGSAATLTSGTKTATSSFTLASANTSPSDIVSDGTTFWVTDDAANKVFVYTGSGSLLGSWSLDTRNADASGLTINPNGGNDLWVVDRVDDTVYHYANGRTFRSGTAIASDIWALACGNHGAEGIADPPPAIEAEEQPGLDAASPDLFSTDPIDQVPVVAEVLDSGDGGEILI